MLYDELLESAGERFHTFLKNVPTFENQFVWSECNERCYRAMYEENPADAPVSVAELKDQIPELRELCKKCAAFYVRPRNNSILKYDLLLGKQHEEVLMSFLSRKLDAVVERGDLEDRSYPDCRILRSDGSIAAYFEVKFHGAPFINALHKTGRYCYEGSATLDCKKIEKQLALIDTEITAPVYYLHWIEYPCLKGIFCERSEDVKQYISEQHTVFERKLREGDLQKSKDSVYLTKMYSPLLRMMPFEQFLSELRALVRRDEA